jgi:hypothetical protein
MGEPQYSWDTEYSSTHERIIAVGDEAPDPLRCT